jgi:hypothetical protein
MSTDTMAKAASIRKLCAVRGINLAFAREAHANYRERENDAKARMADAQELAGFWLRIVEAFEAEP